MVSLKRAFDEDDDTVAAVNPAGLVSRKFAKTYKLACEFIAVDAEATQAQAAQVTPTASAAPAPVTVPAPVPANVPASAPANVPVSAPETVPAPVPANVPASAPANVPASAPETVPAPVPATVLASAPATVPAPAPASTLTPAPVTMTEDMSEDENEGSSKQLGSAMPKDKGKGPASQYQPNTAENLPKREWWRKFSEEQMAEKIESERADAAWNQMEICEKEEKKSLKKAKKDWEAKAKKMMEEEITKQVGAMNKWWQEHYEKEKKNCQDEMAQKLQQQVESFKPHFDEALEAVQKAEKHADDQAQLGHRVWADLETKQREANILQSRLNEVNASLAKGLAQEQEDAVITVVNQKDREIDRLTAELAQSRSKVEDANKARDHAVNQLADKADEVKKLEEKLDEVRGLNRDLNTAGAEKDQKLQKTIQQLEKVLEKNRTAPQASQQVTKGPNGESQAPTRKSKSANASNQDARLLEATLAKCREQERLVRDLRRKLAKLARDSDSQLKDVKRKMSSRLKEAMEEKEKAVQQLATSQDSGQLTKLKTEHRILQRRNQDMARKAMEDAADIGHLTAQTKLLHSDRQNLLHESHRLRLRGDSYRAQLEIQSGLLDRTESRIFESTIAATAKDNKMAKMVKARDAKIRALEKTVREGEEMIATLRQWDAESGVTERDERIGRLEMDVGRLEKDEKEALEHIEMLECELLKYRNVGLVEKLSAWIFGTPPV